MHLYYYVITIYIYVITKFVGMSFKLKNLITVNKLVKALIRQYVVIIL